MSSLHLGVRLALPAWIFFFLLCGAAVQELVVSRRGILIAAGAVCVSLALTASVYPFGISFFNPYVGGPRVALGYLDDSNIDWGHGLGEAARWARRHRVDKLNLAYFGFDSPSRYFAPGQVANVVPPWSGKSDTDRYQPQPGWYAISASLLPGHFFMPPFCDFFAEFRYRRPVAVAGGSIFIYRIE